MRPLEKNSEPLSNRSAFGLRYAGPLGDTLFVLQRRTWAHEIVDKRDWPRDWPAGSGCATSAGYQAALNATTITIATSHLAMLADPEKVAGFIRVAAGN
ncbi:MAG TPA: hypothetical protein VMR62_19235 [Bryobacteraceae bacterium]|jgi:hypothetical protein|nr:hypothetical protein [Bryobacteraceae bacterium]